MSKKKLKARIRALEERVAALEARPYMWYTTPMYLQPGGYRWFNTGNAPPGVVTSQTYEDTSAQIQ